MQKTKGFPPRFFLKLFRWFCHPEMLDYIEGDLFELYTKRLKNSGQRRANMQFAIDVILLFRPGIIRPVKKYNNLNNYAMIKNYFKIAWRNLLRSKFYSFINISGLTMGLAVGILILLWVQSELSFDKFHSKANTIYRVNSYLGTAENKRVWDVTQGPVATYAMREIPGVINAVRITRAPGTVYTRGDLLLKETNAAYVDPSFFRMFDFDLIKGDPANPFPNDQSMIITASTAKKYFGNEDPIGKILQQDHNENFTVTGLIADFPDNSSINYNMLFPMNIVANQYDSTGFWKTLDSDWGNFGYTTFLEVQAGTPLKPLGEKLIRIQATHAPHIKVSVAENAFQLQAISAIHLYGADGSATSMQAVRIFIGIAVLILLIACINYVNLSTARSLLRAREISIRKIIGAQKKQLFSQFITESILFFAISLVFAISLMILLLPYYNQLSGKQLHLRLFDTGIWKIVLLTFGGTLLIASVYPSLLLSSFEPLKALKGKLSLGIGNTKFRKGLVTTQFVFSVTLIIATLIIGQQLKFIRERDPGYDRSQTFSFQAGKMQEHIVAVKTALKMSPAIEDVSSADNRIVNNGRTTAGVNWDGKDPNATFIIHHLGVDEKFIPLLKIQLVSGKSFSGTKADSTHFLLNETAVAATGLKDPVGKRFKLQETEGTIIGVVKDFNTASYKEKIPPTVIYYEPAGRMLYVKTTGREAHAAIAAATGLWNQYNPGFPFEYNFMDEEYASLYKSDRLIGTLFNLFAFMAVFISCLGLFGLATFTTQVMTREIGIRKVLGASTGVILFLISKDFLKLVALAILVASPIAWWVMNKWLESFIYRIDINWWVFLLAGALAVAIALLSISFQSIKAALTNPVKSLRGE